MAKRVQLRRGTTAEHTSFIGADGEISIDGDKDVVVVHDGSTAGGFPLARQDMSNVDSMIGLAQLDITNTGTPGQVLQKDNGETLTFVSLPDTAVSAIGGDLSGTIGNAQINPNTIGINELDVIDASNGYLLTTNGSGQLYFSDPSSDLFIGGDAIGSLSNISIQDNVIGNENLKLNSVGLNNIMSNSINNDKILDSTITDQKIIGLSADKLVAGSTLSAVKGPDVTELPYDISFIAGCDSETVHLDLVVQIYGEMVMARNGTFEGEVGYISTTSETQPIIVDVEKNDTSIYATPPFFGHGTGYQVMTSGSLLADNMFTAGDRITFKVTQIGIGTIGKGLRFTLKCRV